MLIKVRYWLEVRALLLAVAIAGFIPRSLLGRIGSGLGMIAFALDRTGRNTAMENLRCVFPEKTPEERRNLAIASYRNMARTFLDLFWSPNLTEANWQEHVELVLEDPTGIEEATGSGAIWVTPHFGNFEWTSLIWGLRGLQFQIIAQRFRNPALTPIFQRLRECTGHQVIPQERSMVRLYKALRRGGHAAFLTDLNVELNQSPVIIECFGMKTCVTSLHAMLALRCGVPVIPALATRLNDGRYELRMMPALAFTESTSPWEMAQQCWDVFEARIREHPEQWIWMYKHWRYRPEGAEVDAYPDYANPKRKFDRTLAAQLS